MHGLTLVHSATPSALLQTVPARTTSVAPESGSDWRFNSHDLIALTCWMQRTDGHGYRRILVEAGIGDEESEGGAPENGGYVLVYAPGRDWATWGLARSGSSIVVWHCSTGSDVGRFDTMLLALDSLPNVATSPRRTVETRRPQPRLTLVHRA